MLFLCRVLFAAFALNWTATASSTEHPCDQLSTNSALGEIWPDEFTRLVKDMARKPKGPFVKTTEYAEDEQKRYSNIASRYPMFAVVSKASWGDFSYDADSELLRLKLTSLHAVSPCGNGKYCSKLFGWGDEPVGRLEHSRDLPSITFRILPAEIEKISKTEQPIFYYVVSASYPFVDSSADDNLKVDLHCAALVSDDDSSIRDNDDRLLHLWAPLENQTSPLQVTELFQAQGCGLAVCNMLGTTGWGMVRIGANYETIRAAIAGNKLEPTDDSWCFVTGEGWPDGVSAFLNSRKQIDNINIDEGSGVRAPNIRTEKGIQIGSSLADLRKAYPEAKPQPEYDGQVDYIVKIGVVQKLMFRTMDGRVTSMGLGSEPAAERDGCPTVG